MYSSQLLDIYFKVGVCDGSGAYYIYSTSDVSGSFSKLGLLEAVAWMAAQEGTIYLFLQERWRVSAEINTLLEERGSFKRLCIGEYLDCYLLRDLDLRDLM